jgi:hypothetical protein
MSGTETKDIVYRSGYKAQLVRPALCYSEIYPPENIHEKFYTILTNGTIIGHEGYAWNFANCFPDFNSIRRGSLFHDIVCQAVREGKLEKKWLRTSNTLLMKHCIEDGMMKWLAKKVRKYTNKFAGKGEGDGVHRLRSAPNKNAWRQDA